MGATIPRANLSEPIEPPFVPPTTFHQVNQNKAYLDGLWNSGRLELASYNRACASQQEYANNIEAELKQIAAQGGGSDTTIRIEGGLPQLPGTNINMAQEPTLEAAHNGHVLSDASNGHVIEHEPAVPSEAPDDVCKT